MTQDSDGDDRRVGLGPSLLGSTSPDSVCSVREPRAAGVSGEAAKGAGPLLNNLKIIGITGGIASGKTTVARMFEGIRHLDADAMVHHLMRQDAEIIAAIAAAFPDAVCDMPTPNQQTRSIDRAVLARIVSQNLEALRALERILHPSVWALEEQAIAEARAAGEKAIILDVPLLFETDAHTLCDVVIVVHAPLEKRRDRAFARDGMTEEKWQRILARQLPDHERLARAHHVIHTSTSMDETRAQVAALMKELGLS